MAKYSRLEVIQVMKEIGMVPLFYHNDVEVAKNILKACYDGGARLLEFTNRGDFAHEVFAEINKYALVIVRGMGGKNATSVGESTGAWIELEIKMSK